MLEVLQGAQAVQRRTEGPVELPGHDVRGPSEASPCLLEQLVVELLADCLGHVPALLPLAQRLDSRSGCFASLVSSTASLTVIPPE
jgi:hypothetical protein